MDILKNSDYENRQIELIKDWEQQVPGVVSKGVGLLAKPAPWLVQQVVPQSAIKAALNAANSAGKKLADESDILRDGNVTMVEELRKQSLETSDRLADEVHNWAIGMATAEGGAAGFTGVAGIAADIPAVLTLALRTIHKIGLCYGYRADTKEEQDFVLSILSAAGSNTQKEKTSALLALKSIEVLVAKQTWKAISVKAETQLMGKELGVIAIKNLCKQLGINLTKRKALQAIPGVGAFVGAAVNADFLRDVGYAARRVYQKRWLEENGKWKDTIDV